VTAVVRDPARHAALAGDGVRLVAGDVRDEGAVAGAAAGCAAVVHAAAEYGPGTDPASFFPAAARAVLAGARQAGAGRLVAVGLSAFLRDAAGRTVAEALGVPAEFEPFVAAHRAGLEVLRAEGGDVDWVYVSPAGDFDHGGARTGRYRLVPHGDAASRVSYADFAVAVVDEAVSGSGRRAHLAVDAVPGAGVSG
jgi:putative NADH-flavin reductase